MENVSKSTKPVKVFRLRGVSVSVFENRSKAQGRVVTFFKAALQRTYKEGDEFKATSSLSRDDLPAAQLLLERAWEFILKAEADSRKASSEDEEEE